MKIKNILWVSMPFSAPLAFVACSSNNIDNVEQYIDKRKDVISIKKSEDEVKIEKIINQLLDKIFVSDTIAKVAFINQQEDQKYQEEFWKQVQTISDLNEQNSKVAQLKKLYSDNWYLVLKNIAKFNLIFHKWYVLPEAVKRSGEIVKMSDEYLESIDKLEPYPNFKFSNNFLEEIKEGETSGNNELVTDLFILKNNAILSIQITYIDNKAQVSFLPYFYYFPKAKNKVSISLMANVFHYAIIHKDQFAYDNFEKTIIGKLRYGNPVLILMTLKVQNEN